MRWKGPWLLEARPALEELLWPLGMLSVGEQEESPGSALQAHLPECFIHQQAQPMVEGVPGGCCSLGLTPPPTLLSSLQHFLSWEELGPAPHSLPSAQDLEEVVPNWAGAGAVTWDPDFEKQRLVHVMHPSKAHGGVNS